MPLICDIHVGGMWMYSKTSCYYKIRGGVIWGKKYFCCKDHKSDTSSVALVMVGRCMLTKSQLIVACVKENFIISEQRITA